jgi:hypothetical protein
VDVPVLHALFFYYVRAASVRQSEFRGRCWRTTPASVTSPNGTSLSTLPSVSPPTVGE